MKKSGTVWFALIALMSCNTKNKVQNLPKDAALKPPHESQVDADRQALSNLRKKIDSLAGLENCTNASEWRISPIGSKPCGGPADYMAYPIKLEKEILPEIQKYTQQQSDFNRKNGLMSDCAVVPAPAGIRCEEGKPVLIKAAEESVQ